MRIEAEARAGEAETRAGEAEARARQPEARAREAEARARKLEARAREAEARAIEAEARAREAEARAALLAVAIEISRSNELAIERNVQCAHDSVRLVNLRLKKLNRKQMFMWE